MQQISIPPEVYTRLRKSLPKLRSDWVGGYQMVRIPISPADLPVPHLARFLLVDVMGCPALPRGDKTAWEVGFVWDNRPCAIAHQKFGVRLYVAGDAGKSSDRVSADIVRRLNRSIRILEREVLAPVADAQLRSGDLSIANQAGRLRGMYEHFRTQADAAFQDLQAPPTSPASIPDIAGRLSAHFRSREVAACNALAMVNAYFSLIEHTLVLVLPFTPFSPEDGRLKTFISSRWREKYRCVFDISQDKAAKLHHDALYKIAESYRNTYSHGGFDKDDTALWLHLPGIGATPARLSDIRDSPHFGLFPVDEPGLTEICQAFDAVDAFLRASDTACFGMQWIDAGLDVSFDAESRTRYAESMVTEDNFIRAIEAQSNAQDAIMNFEL